MAEPSLARVVVPVASKMDAERTCSALLPHLDETRGEAHVVHVVEHTEGYLDTAPVEQLEEDAEHIFGVVRETFQTAGFSSFETHLSYGTDVVEAIYDVCEELDADAVVFVTRQSSRWKRMLTGDVALQLITENPYPAVVLPEPDVDAASEPEEDNQA